MPQKFYEGLKGSLSRIRAGTLMKTLVKNATIVRNYSSWQPNNSPLVGTSWFQTTVFLLHTLLSFNRPFSLSSFSKSLVVECFSFTPIIGALCECTDSLSTSDKLGWEFELGIYIKKKNVLSKHIFFIDFLIIKERLLEGCLRYETMFCDKVVLNVQLMNFFIWRKNVSFSRYLDLFFVKSIDFKARTSSSTFLHNGSYIYAYFF